MYFVLQNANAMLQKKIRRLCYRLKLLVKEYLSGEPKILVKDLTLRRYASNDFYRSKLNVKVQKDRIFGNLAVRQKISEYP